MANYEKVGRLKVSKDLLDFINNEALPGTETDAGHFWGCFEQIITDFAPKNKILLEKRANLQKQINDWHNQNKHFEPTAYKDFLTEIGYLENLPDDFDITTTNVDEEITSIPGPQLVVPISNARYALNAANARWGSFYDAIYGSNIIDEEDGKQKSSTYNQKRGVAVIAYAKTFLDEVFPLANGSHKEAVNYTVSSASLSVTLENGSETALKNSDQFQGYLGQQDTPKGVLLQNNNLYIEISLDKDSIVGKEDKAGIKDILLESAITVIMDLEDSVAAVDAEDKIVAYKNWLGLMKGDLTASFQKGDNQIIRKLNADRHYTSKMGTELHLKGRSLMLVRNVGHLMTNPAILTADGSEIPEGIMDCMVTSVIAKHDLLKKEGTKNSTAGSVYIVKPKMHGPEEVYFANELFNRVEDALGLKRDTLKIGVMDEERRTSLNLLACIKEVSTRIAFINTGFLDRTGDEMHTSMEAGAMVRKNAMKSSIWLTAYEKSNVASGLKSGFKGKSQIGKGMWAMPDLMKEMIEQKVGHVTSGANTAWVPSPTAATLHATHYHAHVISDIQDKMQGGTTDYRDSILTIPLDPDKAWTPEEIQSELDNNAQGILGYVVRWVDQGIGCSKVPDINNVALMEDRATLRISSQHMANWLRHGITTQEQIVITMEKMAKVVDEQNKSDKDYTPMAPNFDKSIAYKAALDLVLQGTQQPSGYTEPILHRARLAYKACK